MRLIVFFLALAFGTLRLAAQGVEDSVRFCTPDSWNVLQERDGIRVSELKSRCGKEETFLFGVPQHIYVMEIAPGAGRLRPAQEAERRTVSRLVREHGALAGVNGGFFVVKPEPKNAAVANDFLKIGGRVVSPDPTPGWGDAAVGIDSGGGLHFTVWSKAMDADTLTGWSAAFPDVLAAGPMLVRDGVSLHAWTAVDKGELTKEQKHAMYAPRTAVGVRGDGTAVLLVVDGRRAKAFGASFPEMSVLGRWLGLEELLNLDGGGSSAMVVGRRLVNFPSDGQGILPLERRVANALLVVPVSR